MPPLRTVVHSIERSESRTSDQGCSGCMSTGCCDPVTKYTCVFMHTECKTRLARALRRSRERAAGAARAELEGLRVEVCHNHNYFHYS
jgi:hypothetical protein